MAYVLAKIVEGNKGKKNVWNLWDMICIWLMHLNNVIFGIESLKFNIKTNKLESLE